MAASNRRQTVSRTYERIPQHLRQFVVEQDTSMYNAVDQAVWRFVLLQMYESLQKTAHPAYASGLSDTGISVERIPSIAEMDERLSRFGWGAVCVDGFIPPRAFQEFQALGVLPIAAEIRTARHLVYTPAPDIIHEAAGHAPILPDAQYAAYLRRIGQFGARAFSSPEDEQVYRAIFLLSELKERPETTLAQLSKAEEKLERALRGVTYTTEAAQLSRLYWWTAEYGLVGTPKDYKLYGAGLLSSLGESHSCHAPQVEKLPLTARCVDVGYDITREQPQLFVTESFAELEAVLDDVTKNLAYRRGGLYALNVAQKSQELATIRLNSGAEVIGTLASVDARGASETGQGCLLYMRGPCGLAEEGRLLESLHRIPCATATRPLSPEDPDRWIVIVDRLRDGTALSGLEPAALLRWTKSSNAGDSELLEFDYANQTRVRGRYVRSVTGNAQQLLAVTLRNARVECPAAPPLHFETLQLVVGERVESAGAGASDASFHRATEFPPTRVPRPRSFSPEEHELIKLYGQAMTGVRRAAGSAGVQVLESIWQRLNRDYPEEWLLRWFLLESLTRSDDRSPLRSNLQADLERLELVFDHKQPILMGLRYLARFSAPE